MPVETIRASTWTNTSGSQTGTFSGSPTTGTFNVTTLTAVRTATGFSKSNTWTSYKGVVSIAEVNVIAGSDLDMMEFNTSSLGIQMSTDAGSTWVEFYNTGAPAQFVANDDGSINLFGLTYETSAISGNPNTANLRFRVTGIKGSKIGIDGIPGTSYLELSDIRIEGTYSSDALTSATWANSTVDYGATNALTVVFTGAAPTVSPGSWSTWVSGTAQWTGANTATGTRNYTVNQSGVNYLYPSFTVRTPAIGTITFSKNPVTRNSATLVSATITQAATGYNGATFSSNASGTWDSGTGYIAGPTPQNAFTPTIAGNHTITLTSHAGNTATAVLSVVEAPNISSFVASSTSPLYGAAVTLTPTFSNGTGSISPTIGAVSSGTGYSPGAMTSQVTYTLTVTNAAGDSTTAQVTVTPQTVSVSISPVNSFYWIPGYTRQFSATVTGAVNTGVNWSCTGGSITSGGLWTPPTTPGNYTVTATSQADGTKSASCTVTVQGTPAVTSFTASPNPQTAPGGNVDLSWATSNASSIDLGTTSGGAEIMADGPDAGTFTVTPTTTTTYYLQAKNAGSDTVGALIVASVTVQMKALLAASRQQKFTATATLLLPKPLAASQQQKFTATGAITTAIRPNASVGMRASASATLTAAIRAAGAAAQRQSVTPTLQLLKHLGAAPTQVQAVSATLQAQIRAAATLIQHQTVAANVVTAIRLAGSPTLVQTLSGGIQAQILLQGAAALSQQAVLQFWITLHAAQVQSASGSLLAQVRMLGSLGMAASASGQLTAMIRLAAGATLRASVEGDIATNIRLEAHPVTAQVAQAGLTVQIRLWAGLQQVQAVSGGLFVTRPVNSSVGMRQTVQGNLATAIRMAASIQQKATAQGANFQVFKFLFGAVAQRATVGGAIVVLKLLQGTLRQRSRAAINSRTFHRRPYLSPEMAEMIQKLTR